MQSFRELFSKLQELDETVEIEAKAGSDVGSSTLATISAFSNEPGRNGGHILFGVERDDFGLFGPQYRVIGVPDADKLQRDFVTQCAGSFNVTVRPDVQVEVDAVTHRRVVVAFIPEAPATAKPVFIKSKGLPQGAFRRVSSADVVCTDDDLRILFQLQGVKGFDETIVGGSSWDDIDPEALRTYRRYRSDANPTAAELAYDDLELAKALFAVDRDRNGSWIPTVAGLILFGTRKALRRFFPLHRIDYLRIPGTKWVRQPDERYEAVEIREPLLSAIPHVISTILDDIPKAFHLPPDSARRRDIPALPAVAIREAVVNAVMHRTYKTPQPVQILRYANRIEIRNPGVSLVPDERLGEPGSYPRNEKIAATLHEAQFAETKGSGIKAIRDSMENAGLLPPYFESDRTRDTFVATFLFHHLLQAEELAWISQLRDLHLSDQDCRALIFLKETGAIDNSVFRMLNHVDVLSARTRLRTLRDWELLEQKGRAAGTYYIPGKRLLEVLDSIGLKAKPPARAATKRRRRTAAVNAIQTVLPAELRERIDALGARADASTLDALILDLLNWRSLNAKDLAAATRRTERNLRERSLKRLLNSRRIRYRYPDEPTHPDQAYEVVRKRTRLTPAELRSRRIALGLSFDELARATGVDADTIRKWETGDRPIDSPQLIENALRTFENYH